MNITFNIIDFRMQVLGTCESVKAWKQPYISVISCKKEQDIICPKYNNNQ